jgi:hypothetical protein
LKSGHLLSDTATDLPSQKWTGSCESLQNLHVYTEAELKVGGAQGLKLHPWRGVAIRGNIRYDSQLRRDMSAMIRSTVFSNVTPCNPATFIEVSGEPTSSVFKAKEDVKQDDAASHPRKSYCSQLPMPDLSSHHASSIRSCL